MRSVLLSLLFASLALTIPGESGMPTPRYRDLQVFTVSQALPDRPETIVARTQFVNRGAGPMTVRARLAASPSLQLSASVFAETITAGASAEWRWSFTPPTGLTRAVLRGEIDIDGRRARDLYVAIQGPDPASFADRGAEQITERARVVATYAPRTQASIDAALQRAARRPKPVLTLASAGHSAYAIVVEALPSPPAGQDPLITWKLSPDLTDAQHELAQALGDLQRCIALQSGAALPVVTATAGPALRLRLGDPKAPAGLQDSYRLRTVDRDLVITAASLDGLRNGIYGLLTDHLDCHWFQPRGLGEEIIIPRDRTVRLPALDDVQDSPWFSSVGVSWWNSMPWDRQMRSTINRGRMVFGHSWNTYINSTEYPFDKYPEYYARDRQGRIRMVGANGDQTNFCSTNPEVIAIVARKVNAYFAANPDAIVKSLDPDDYAPLCLCDRCLALDKSYGQQKENGTDITDRVIHFSNEIYQRLDPQFKDRYLGILAYGYQMELPLGAKPHDHHATLICNFPPRYDHSRPWNDPTSARNRDFYRLLTGWGSRVAQLGYYDYYGHWAYFGPWDITQKIREDLPAFRELGGTFVIYEAQPNFAMQGLNHYIAGRLTWDLQADVDLLREEFYRKYYGPAAGPMRDFWSTTERYFALERPGTSTESRVAARPEFWSDLDGCLKAAEAAVAGLPAASQRFTDRVRFHRDGFDYGRLVAGYDARYAQARRTGSAADRAAVLAYLQENRVRLEGLEQCYAADQDPYWPPLVRPLFFLNVADAIAMWQR